MSAFAGRFLLGVNYWSRAGGPRMWERFDEARVRAELQQMRALGLDCCRAFAFLPTFMPEPPAVREEARARLRQFLALAGQERVGVLMTGLVGHMSGENFGFPGQGNRSLYLDGELRAWQRALFAALAADGRDAESVLGWVLSNEMPLFAGPAPKIAVASWAVEMVEVLRSGQLGGVRRPIGSGDGLMPGFPARAIASELDWVAPHVYYADTDPLRQGLATDYALRAAEPLGRPLLLEEFGCAATQAGEREQAAAWREAICAALSLGARGALGWCFSDFDVETLGRETPYSHHGFELGFGVTRADGSEKPVCDELRALRGFLDGLDLTRLAAPPPRVALLRSRYLDDDIPFSWQDGRALSRALVQSFVLATQAGLEPTVVGEDDDLTPYALILVPATQKLTVPTWLALKDAAQAGATIYWSYHAGDHDFHVGSWCPIFGALTGLDHRLRAGQLEPPPERFTLKGEVALSVPTGVAHTQAPWSLSRLPIELREGAPVRTLAVDGEGRPALTEHALGRGRVLFLAWPLERYLSVLADGSSRDAHRLYRLAGERAGLTARYETRHPDVFARVMNAESSELVFVTNRGPRESVDDATDVPRDAQVLFDRGNPAPDALGPKGVRVYRVVR